MAKKQISISKKPKVLEIKKKPKSTPTPRVRGGWYA